MQTKHISLPTPTAEEVARFLENTQEEPSNGCLLWTGKVDRYGVGQFSYQGRRVSTRRFAYTMTHGDPKEKHVVLASLCVSNRCVEYSHLRLEDKPLRWEFVE
jgi:hypothetical protein